MKKNNPVREAFRFGLLIDKQLETADLSPMDADDLFPKSVNDPLVALQRQDLDPLSVEELKARIVSLETEIARAKTKIEKAVNHRASAEGLFKQ
jgi:uncharacterized small protein (DUF1192 family)